MLALGIAVYVFDRDWSTVYFLGWLSNGAPATPGAHFGRLGSNLPSFAHAYSFSLVTALILRPWRWAMPLACGLWAAIDGAFELAQRPEWGVAQDLRGVFDGVPLLENIPAYLAKGSFDLWDLAAIGLGCACAYLTFISTRRYAGGTP